MQHIDSTHYALLAHRAPKNFQGPHKFHQRGMLTTTYLTEKYFFNIQLSASKKLVDSAVPVAILEWKKWGGHGGVKEKVGGAT